MATTLEWYLERPMSAPRDYERPSSPAPAVERRGRSTIELDSALLEAVAILLLQNCTPRAVVREAQALKRGPVGGPSAATREARIRELDRRLMERGGWDEV